MPSFSLERQLYRAGFSLVAGADEVGRGPLAGPLVMGVMVLPKELDESQEWVGRIRDSKRLTPRQRERLLPELRHHAMALATGQATPGEIDDLGLTSAIALALKRALRGLGLQPDYLLLDFMPLPQVGIPCQAIVNGDDLCCSIAAASVLAKVTRDRQMEEADRRFPGYGFARHKGYYTREHREALRRLGPCPIHRRSFAPVRAVLEG